MALLAGLPMVTHDLSVSPKQATVRKPSEASNYDAVLNESDMEEAR